jgi:hypothetical protein
MKRWRCLVLILILALIMGCASPSASEPTDTPVPQASGTPEALPSPTNLPTNAPEATDAPEATATPLPTTAGASSPTAEPTAPPTPSPPPPTAEPRPAWQADGEIGEDEYRHVLTIGSVEIGWFNDAEYLYAYMDAPTSGWVSIGFDPDNRMQGANFIIGAVVDGELDIMDAWGVTPTGPDHPPDEQLGGRDDIVAAAGVEEDERTLIEFQIPLDSGDAYDKPLTPGGTYTILVAFGSSNDLFSYHGFRGVGQITLDPVE